MILFFVSLSYENTDIDLMKRLFIFVCFFFFLISAYPQYTNIMISNSGYPEETSIMINPKNPNQVIAGANIDFYYYSNDAGLTWNMGILNSSYGVWGDPCVFIDTAGFYYFLHLSDPPAGGWIDRMVCQKS